MATRGASTAQFAGAGLSVAQPLPGTSAAAREAVRGGVWMIGLRFADRLLGLASTLVLARLLVPADFGIVAVAMSFVAAVEVLGSLGLDLSLLRRRELERPQLDAVWSLNLAIGAAGSIVLAVAALPLTAAFDEQRLLPVLLVLSALPLAGAMENIGTVFFRRDLDFAAEFRWQMARRVISVLVTVALALALRSYWALVAGIVAGRLLGTVLSYLLHPYRPRWQRQGWGELRGYSIAMFLHSAAQLVRQRLPDVAVGHVFGLRWAGLNTVAAEVAALPSTELAAPLNRVLLPVLGRLQAGEADLKRALLASLSALASTALPAAIGLALLAPDLIRLLLGPQWTEAGPLLQAMALAGGITVLQGPCLPVLIQAGQMKQIALAQWVGTAALLTALAWVLRAGRPELLGWPALAGSVVLAPLSLGFASRCSGCSAGELMRTLLRPLLACAIMAAVVTSLLDAFGDARGDWPAMIAASTVGAIVFASASLVLWLLGGRRTDGDVLAAQHVFGLLTGSRGRR
jgi:O-antigen/teichoic acid export membrane protein